MCKTLTCSKFLRDVFYVPLEALRHYPENTIDTSKTMSNYYLFCTSHPTANTAPTDPTPTSTCSDLNNPTNGMIDYNMETL